MEVDLRTLALQNRRVSIRMEQMADRMLAGTGLTAAQGNVLCFILEHGREGTSLTDIHREFGFSKATLCRILKNLKGSGYLRVEPCPGDERRKLLFYTEKGGQIQAYLKEATEQACRRAYRGFSQKDLEEMDRLQKQMMENLSAQAPAWDTFERSEDFEERIAAAGAL